jgi:hypothetical protein
MVVVMGVVMVVVVVVVVVGGRGGYCACFWNYLWQEVREVTARLVDHPGQATLLSLSIGSLT